MNLLISIVPPLLSWSWLVKFENVLLILSKIGNNLSVHTLSRDNAIVVQEHVYSDTMWLLKCNESVAG